MCVKVKLERSNSKDFHEVFPITLVSLCFLGYSNTVIQSSSFEIKGVGDEAVTQSFRDICTFGHRACCGSNTGRRASGEFEYRNGHDQCQLAGDAQCKLN